MAKTPFEKGFEQGVRMALMRLIGVRFGSPSQAVRDRLSCWPADRLLDLADALVEARSLRELGLEEQSDGNAVGRVAEKLP